MKLHEIIINVPFNLKFRAFTIYRTSLGLSQSCHEAVDTVQWQSFQMLCMRLAIDRVIHHQYVGSFPWEFSMGTYIWGHLGNMMGIYWDRMRYDNCMFMITGCV